MTSSDVLRLISLAAIWGGSFIFLRTVVPELGAVWTAGSRLLLAGTGLLLYYRLVRLDFAWRRFWKQYLAIGVVNSAIPFLCYSYAAKHIPAAYSVILNSTAPLFGAICSALWLGERLTSGRTAGLALGALGVGFIAGSGSGAAASSSFSWGILACLVAALCYALAGIYIKRFASGANSGAVAGASQLLAGVLLLPLAALFPPASVPGTSTVLHVLALAFLCSAVAYLLYFRLIADVGPTRALTVTFLMPVFGMFWGWLFLGETITPAMLVGCAMIVCGTALVARTTPALGPSSRLGAQAGRVS